MIYRQVDEQEARAFRVWANENYKPHEPINGCWHPAAQIECARINALHGRLSNKSWNVILDSYDN